MSTFWQLLKLHWIKVIVGFFLTAAGLWLAFKDVNLPQVWSIIRNVRIPWLLVFGFLTLFQLFIRGVRWHYLAAHNKKMPSYSLYKICAIGFALNSILPLRIGEFARAVILKKKHNLTFSFGFSTIVVERVYDLLAVLILFTPLLLRLEIPPDFRLSFEGYEISGQIIEALVRNVAYMTTFVFLVILAFQFSFFQELGLKVIEFSSKILPARFFQKIKSMYLQLIHGFQSLKNARAVIMTLLLSFAVWLLVGLSFYAASRSIPEITLNYHQALFTSLMICFGVMIPSAPGYWGLFELAGMFALVLLNFDEGLALSFTLVVHVVQMFFIVSFGLFYLAQTGISLSDILEDVDADKV